MIEQDIAHRGLNNPDMNFGRRSENSELLGSVNSSQDYWQRIETKFANRELTKKANSKVTKEVIKQNTLEKRN